MAIDRLKMMRSRVGSVATAAESTLFTLTPGYRWMVIVGVLVMSNTGDGNQKIRLKIYSSTSSQGYDWSTDDLIAVIEVIVQYSDVTSRWYGSAPSGSGDLDLPVYISTQAFDVTSSGGSASEQTAATKSIFFVLQNLGNYTANFEVVWSIMPLSSN